MIFFTQYYWFAVLWVLLLRQQLYKFTKSFPSWKQLGWMDTISLKVTRLRCHLYTDTESMLWARTNSLSWSCASVVWITIIIVCPHKDLGVVVDVGTTFQYRARARTRWHHEAAATWTWSGRRVRTRRQNITATTIIRPSSNDEELASNDNEQWARPWAHYCLSP